MEENKKFEFYGGNFGPWIPVLFMIVSMVLCTITGNGGLQRFCIISFAALAIGFFLAKDKKNFGQLSLKGLRNPMLGTVIMAYLLAGILSQLLRQSGLIDSLILVVSELNLNVGFLPLVGFITCMLISTSCGTSTGSVAAVAPVLIPLAYSLGVDIGLMSGAIISGAIFGDNVAPISDTTISSALTQEAKIGDVVRTRLPYSVISAVISAALFVVIGLRMGSTDAAHFVLEGASFKPLILMVLPLTMVVMMKMGWDLTGTLIVCNVAGVVLNVLLGTISAAAMFTVEGPVFAGMNGMMVLVLYVLLLFQVLEILMSSGAFDALGAELLKLCKSPRSAELVCYIIASVGSAASGGSGIAIVFFGSLVRKITKTFHIDRCRGANILDGVACGATGLMPHGNPVNVVIGVVLTLEGFDPNFSFLNILPYNFHCWGLLILFLLSILTGIGRKFENGEMTEESPAAS